MPTMLNSKSGNYYSLIYGIIAFVVTVIVYIIVTPIINKLMEIGEELLADIPAGMTLLATFETVWNKALIPVIVVSIIIYMIVSAYRREPYQETI